MGAADRNWSLVAGMSSIHFVQHVFRILPPVLPLLAIEFPYPLWKLGALVSVYFLGSGLGQTPVGILADRYDRRLILPPGIGLMGLGYLVFAMAPRFVDPGAGAVTAVGTTFTYQYLLMGAGALLAGLGASAIHPVGYPLVAANVPAETTGSAYGVWGSAAKFGDAAAPATVAVLIFVVRWDEIFLLFGLLGIAYAVALFYAMSGPWIESRPADQRDSRADETTIETGTETEANAETRTGTAPETEAPAGTATETETGTEAPAETVTETEPETETHAETATETEPETETHAETATETEPETETHAETPAEPQTETETESETGSTPESTPEESTTPAWRTDRRHYVYPMIALFVFFVARAFSEKGLKAFLPTFLVVVYGYSFTVADVRIPPESFANFYFMAVFLVAAVVQLGTGLLVDRYDHRTVLIAFFAAATLAVLALATVSLSPVALLAVLLLLGASNWGWTPARDTLVNDVTPPTREGRTFGYLHTVSHLVSAIAPIVIGFLAEGTSLQESFVYLAATMLVAAGAIGSLYSRRVYRPVETPN
jgi:MFS family permease